MRQADKSRRTKQAIFDAAAEILKKKGLRGLTIAALCEKAGVTNGRFYHHFKSKEDLLKYFFLERFDEWLASRQARTSLEDFGGDFWRQNVALALLCADYFIETGREFLLAYYAPSNRALASSNTESERKAGESVHQSQDRLTVEWLRGLHTAKERGYLRDDLDVDEVITELRVILKGSVFEWCSSARDLDLKHMLVSLQNAYFSAMVTPAYYEAFGHSPASESAPSLRA